MSSLIIGLTGGIASGKTTVSNMFADLGIDIIDADVIARDVVALGSKGLQAIAARFGDKILLKNGELNRPALREIVFSQPEDKAWLNALLHPMIREQMLAQTAQAKSRYCILSVPLLIENKLDEIVDRTLVVDIDEQLQLMRAMARDNSSKSVIEGIMQSQATREQRLKVAHDIIYNDKDIYRLEEQVKQLHEYYLQLAY
ncbi:MULTISPECIES: dephospho-CoA kinase [Alteromonadaceae]|jgi:dephospho-CoA kinase|uniref:Dephospho-CoA kinase n=1 Tax=Brumicola blandensis TaxID=3075611 RepID=A0AAW8R634_9ALTE|nr:MULTISPECIES: dephospho-CoA kinase [unclassified Alteromonas]MDT0583275.1 dephospho-CoA kinase [Alteromonas sp. W409]MDT0627581.1 dephospho-CoA kinase [Alteromonas sp. W364]